MSGPGSLFHPHQHHSDWRCVRAKQLTKAGDVTGTSHFTRTLNGSVGARGQTMTTIHRRPQFQAPIYNLPSARVAEREDDQMPAENLSELLGQYQKIRRAKLMISLVTLDGCGKSCGPMPSVFNARLRNTAD